MSYISEHEAQEFFEKCAKGFAPEDAFVIPHTVCVVRTVEILALRLKMDVAQAKSCAWLHDCGYKEGAEGHAAKGLRLCREAGLLLTPEMEDAIANHGTKSEPTTQLGKVMQLADKLSFVAPEMVELFFPEHLQDLKELMGAVCAVIDRQGVGRN